MCRLFCFVSLLVLALLAGCVDYDEEMWLNSDLSGRVAITISVREELVRGQTGLERDMSEDGVRKEVERIPGVKLVSFQSFRDAGKVIAKIALSFDSVEKLTRPETNLGNSTAVSLLGSIHIRREDGKVSFDRALPVMPETNGSSWGSNLFLQGLGSLFLSNNYLTYRLHVPEELITSNAIRIEDSGKVIEWKYTVAQVMRDPPIMSAVWKSPAIISHGLLIAVLILIAMIGVVYIFRRRRRKV
jgi:hypothetical protein